MQVELLEAKTETFGPLGRLEVAAMSARSPRPARVWPTACGGSAPPGAWPTLLVLRHDLRLSTPMTFIAGKAS